MSRRPPSLAARVLALSAAAAVLGSGAAGAEPRNAPPKKVQIEDPSGDANFVNDNSLHQVSGGTVPDFGDVGGPADATAEADLLSVWFTHNAKTVTAHFRTEVPPADTTPVVYFVAANPRSAGDWGCLLFTIRLRDPSADRPEQGYLRDSCEGDAWIDGRLSIGEFGDGTGHLTLTLPRSASGFFADGGVIASPVADARLGVGTAPVTDDTARGADYRFKPSR